MAIVTDTRRPAGWRVFQSCYCESCQQECKQQDSDDVLTRDASAGWHRAAEMQTQKPSGPLHVLQRLSSGKPQPMLSNHRYHSHPNLTFQVIKR